jgi:hypothetical protein
VYGVFWGIVNAHFAGEGLRIESTYSSNVASAIAYGRN